MTNQGKVTTTSRQAIDMRDALVMIQDAEFLSSQKYNEQGRRANEFGAHPDIIEFNRCMRITCARSAIPVFSHCTIRTLEQQLKEFNEGDSKVRFGAHNVGMATDIIHSTLGWNMTKESWLLIGHIGRELIQAKGLCLVSLAWGGDWKFYDPAHWEVRDWRDFQKGFPWKRSKHWDKHAAHRLSAIAAQTSPFTPK